MIPSLALSWLALIFLGLTLSTGALPLWVSLLSLICAVISAQRGR